MTTMKITILGAVLAISMTARAQYDPAKEVLIEDTVGSPFARAFRADKTCDGLQDEYLDGRTGSGHGAWSTAYINQAFDGPGFYLLKTEASSSAYLGRDPKKAARAACQIIKGLKYARFEPS